MQYRFILPKNQIFSILVQITMIRSKQLFWFLSFILFSFAKWGSASHIVGGDFSYRHLSGDSYELKLKMYRDCGNGTSPLPSNMNVGIYDKETNSQRKTIFLRRSTTYPIKYNTSCINPELRCVETGIYVANFTMPQADFHNTEGYYVEWEGCCRNAITKNITNPGTTSMAFYMELPSPYPNGSTSIDINNSPEFTRDPLSYLCVGEFFKYDFKIFDKDGDEIRMRIGAPLEGAGVAGPGSSPKSATAAAPYFDCTWSSGYGVTNYMDGAPDLTVDNDSAYIYLVPTQIGVYVISIIADEYRNGVKIGEVRRELQLEVLICPPRFKPNITTSISSVPNIQYVTIGVESCFELNATDLNTNEILRFRLDTGGMYKILGSSASLDPPDVSGAQNINAKFCWTPACPLDTGKGAYLDFIAYDDSCPFSQDDTIRVKFIVNQVVNADPVLKSTLSSNILNIPRNEQACFTIQGTDANPTDQITMEVLSSSFDVFGAGATLSNDVIVGNSSISTEFCWTPNCTLKIDSPIHLSFVLYDNACPSEAYDTLDITINVLPVLNDPPFITAEGVNVGANNVVNMILDEPNCFSIFAEDLDDDNIELSYTSTNFDFSSSNFSWTNRLNQINQKRNEFCWTPSCDEVADRDSIYLDFLVRDRKCDNEKFDTLRVLFKFNFPDNQVPEIIKPDSAVYTINAGYSRKIEVEGIDENEEDLLILSARPLYESSIPLRIEMNSVQGIGELQSILNVYADCGLNSNTLYPIEVKLLSNKYCNSYDTITKVVNMRVVPLLDLGKPLLPQVFSPNGDGINDFYSIYLANRTICPDKFEFLIFDRWGKKMFETKDPEFAWDGKDCHAGAYVYFMKLSDEKYSGIISLVK